MGRHATQTSRCQPGRGKQANIAAPLRALAAKRKENFEITGSSGSMEDSPDTGCGVAGNEDGKDLSRVIIHTLGAPASPRMPPKYTPPPDQRRETPPATIW